ncbi:unnamed protein product [Rotaria sordida]|uniref:Cytochrome P450 n=1 Tax=Rotaria sordida TaxID=392033 RepID=A0A815GRG0_9BILA|nr:unnamed protein product [Rotaria sordida]
MDAVLRCGFSFETNVQQDSNNPYLTKFTEILAIDNRKLLHRSDRFVAGTETTSTTLAFCTYVLATHPDVQQKLQDEIDANVGDSAQLSTYEIVDNLKYLDMFIKEVNRMFPIVPIVINRLCVRDTTIGQYTIKEGTIVQPDVYSIHYDADLWGPVDPYKFHPERHAVKRHPLAYLPFGAGPRNCVEPW